MSRNAEVPTKRADGARRFSRDGFLSFQRIYTDIAKFLASTELTLALFAAICVVAIPGTLSGTRTIYSSPLFVCLIALLALNLVVCSIRRWRQVARSTLVIHGGVLLTLAGCIATAFGYVSTVNIYEGTSVDQAYRWDMKRDAPLGMNLAIPRVHLDYYPVPVRVGVLRGTKKIGLFTLRTGEGFDLDGYRIEAATLDPVTLNLQLTVLRQNRLIGTADTSGASTLPADFPYAFKLVAYKNFQLKRMWVDLQLSGYGGPPVSGTAEINGPFVWHGLYFYNTQVSRDEAGRLYAGIQIVRDPGRPLVFCGFAIVSLGAVLAFFRRFRGRRGVAAVQGEAV